MFNLYSYLYYTISLSVVVCFLLVLKRVLLDKLSPRWQYGIWGIFALRAVLPLAGSDTEWASFVRWMVETLKQLVEPGLASAFTRLNSLTEVHIPFPVIIGIPASVTDWLFVVYVGGVFLSLAGCILSYRKLRGIIRRGQPASAQVLEQVESVCQAERLNSCEIREIEGISSAFVCGVFKPVLVIPTGTIPERNILLHELLHLRYRDALQNVFWCVIKSINWCNPLIRWACRCIGNDLETLCDQRVLERLEGEARRDYGRTLLSMANERYARAPGTTSLSNGGHFIARRIEAIARFKRYPRGMALVSICLGLVAASTFWVNSGNTPQLYNRPFDRPVKVAMSLASARMYRCTTPAGAVDTYAKGLILADRMLLAAASPLGKQTEVIYGQDPLWLSSEGLIHENSLEWGMTIYNYNSRMNTPAYSLYNLQKVGDCHHGLLVFRSGPFPNEQNVASNYFCAIHPIRLACQDGRWTVEPAGAAYAVRTGADWDQLENIPALKTFAATGEYGYAEQSIWSMLTVRNEVTSDTNNWFLQAQPAFDFTLKPDAAFDGYRLRHVGYYSFTGDSKAVELLGTACRPAYASKGRPELPESLYTVIPEESWEDYQTNVTGSSSGGQYSGICFDLYRPNVFSHWKNKILIGSGEDSDGFSDIGDLPEVPAGFVIRLYLEDIPTEDLFLTEVSQ